MKFLIKLWKKRQLRKAQERYAYWKARQEAYAITFNCSPSFRTNSYNHNKYIEARVTEAKYLERVEILMMEQ